MKCVGFPAYDNCNECELTSVSCHPQNIELSENESFALDDERSTWQKLADARQVVIESNTGTIERLRSKLFDRDETIQIQNVMISERDQELSELRRDA